ncbi:hypothetical protein PVBG_03104 [Plasmodium vivax Brazil I]|uniref:UBP-type domain-containing protein n=1 Tax=Plasmodium vivax (strain Brazil I) TaxID=1033975 RepID=A0A0J9T151_PLAV1|nr:hypothetical protein PVBG_03104 [Plasmodium vivax Brazil I]
MFHLIVYTQEHCSHVNSHLTLFENVYDRNGNKISKHGDPPAGEKKGDTNDDTATQNNVNDERALLKQKPSQEGGGGPKVQHYTSSFLQLYVNDEKNFDLYLIEEEDNGDGGATSVAAEDTRKNQTNSKKGGDKRERGASAKWPKEGTNQKDAQPHEDDKSRRVNLPLHRSHMLFILSLPTHFPFDRLYRLISAYADFIVQVKVFHVRGNICFLDEEESPPGGAAKVERPPGEQSDEGNRRSECNRHSEGNRRSECNRHSEGNRRSECNRRSEDNPHGECPSTPGVEQTAVYQRIHSVVKRRLKKKKKMKSYSVLIFFKTQIYADMFYSEYHCTGLDHLVESHQVEWHNVVDVQGEKGYPDWYVYCAFVSLVYYIVDGEVGTRPVEAEALPQVEESLRRSEGKVSELKKGSKETHGGGNQLPSSSGSNPFDINHFESFQKSVITDGNTCISTCPLCMELLCEEICFTLTRSKKWSERKRGKASKLRGYLNLSCNVCSLIFLYDSVSRLLGGGALGGAQEGKQTGKQTGVTHSIDNCARDGPGRLGRLVGSLKCRHCSNVDDVWLCLTCANIGCGRYQKSHAKMHSNRYNHHYCLNLKTKKVWNYMREAFIEDKVEDDQSELASAWRGGSGPTGGGFYSSAFHPCVGAAPPGRGDFVEDEYDLCCGDEHPLHPTHDGRICDKIYEIFTDDAYVSDGLKNELLYSLYSLLSHQSNVYNNSLIELQCSYMNRVDVESRDVQSVRDAVDQVESQNREMEGFLRKAESSIRAKNNERAQLQEKIRFLTELNGNIVSQRRGVSGGDDRDDDSRKIKRLDETIRALQAQVDELLRGLSGGG